MRAVARSLGLNDLSELPAAPCLSSRVETGIVVEPRALQLIETIEAWLRQALGPAAIRCRIVAHGVRLEFGEEALADYLSPRRDALRESIETAIRDDGRALVGVAPYRQGSAFLRDAHG